MNDQRRRFAARFTSPGTGQLARRMPAIEIHSLDDIRLAPYRSLKTTNATRWADSFIAEGDKLVRRLLASDFQAKSLLVSRRWLEEFAPLAPANCPVLVVPDEWIQTIVGFNFHRGVLACGLRKPSPPLEDLIPNGSVRSTLVVCPDVQDPENLGAILRNSSALGVQGVVLGERSADPFSRRVLRVSMGAAFQLPIVIAEDLAPLLERLADDFSCELWAAVTDADAVAFDRLERPERVALLLGSEGHGLEPRWIARCHRRITIPMRPGVDSLNVAVAAGILLHGLTR